VPDEAALSPESLALDGLAEYLKVRGLGTPTHPTTFGLVGGSILTEWPDPEQHLAYPTVAMDTAGSGERSRHAA